MAAEQLLVVLGTTMGKLNLIGSICAVCVKRSNTTVEIPLRTVTDLSDLDGEFDDAFM